MQQRHLYVVAGRRSCPQQAHRLAQVCAVHSVECRPGAQELPTTVSCVMRLQVARGVANQPTAVMESIRGKAWDQVCTHPCCLLLMLLCLHCVRSLQL
jgi:hypothetical protein